MCDSNWNPGLVRESHHISTEPVDVTVNDVDPPALLDQPLEFRAISQRVSGIGSVVYLAAQGSNFSVVSRFRAVVDQKMSLELTTVDVPHHVHQPGLYAAPVH